jgi:hypothetical protein
MSIWDSIAGLFTGDTYFPDNPQREHRAQELAADCQELIGQLSLIAPKIKSSLGELDNAIATLYGNPAQLPSDAEPVSVKFDQWGVDVAQLVAPLLTTPAVSSALTIASTSYLASTGEIGAAALVEAVGLPAAFEVVIGAAAGVAAVGVVLGIGAIAGAVKREKLQDAIHSGIAARIKLEKVYLINYRLLISIKAILVAVKTLKEAEAATSQVLENIKQMVSTSSAQIQALSNQEAIDCLAALDKGRGSWTAEDY